MSPVDIVKPDLTRYPLFARAKPLQCNIHAGDVLYLPSFWWHEVQSRPDEHRRNIAVNFWYRPFLDKEFPCPSCRHFVSPHYDHLLPNLAPTHNNASASTFAHHLLPPHEPLLVGST